MPFTHHKLHQVLCLTVICNHFVRSDYRPRWSTEYERLGTPHDFACLGIHCNQVNVRRVCGYCASIAYARIEQQAAEGHDMQVLWVEYIRQRQL